MKIFVFQNFSYVKIIAGVNIKCFHTQVSIRNALLKPQLNTNVYKKRKTDFLADVKDYNISLHARLRPVISADQPKIQLSSKNSSQLLPSQIAYVLQCNYDGTS